MIRPEETTEIKVEIDKGKEEEITHALMDMKGVIELNLGEIKVSCLHGKMS